MKKGTSKTSLIASVAISLSILPALAEDTPSTSNKSTTTTTTTVTATTSETVKLPYGVEDVLKLSRAQVSDDVIMTYIQNTGTIYNLAPKDIVYLKEQGVSDRIINTMMDQRRVASEVALQTQQQQAAVQQQADANAQNNTPVTTQAYSEPEPESAPAVTQGAPSTLYVIPYPTPAYPRYSYYYPYSYSYPYTYSYYGYSRPVIGFRFGFGGRSFHSYHPYHHFR